MKNIRGVGRLTKIVCLVFSILFLTAGFVAYRIASEPCFNEAEKLDFQGFKRFPLDIEKFTINEGSEWSMFVKHETGDHNEGAGKWYLYAREKLEVRAPADMYLCHVDKEQGKLKPATQKMSNFVDGNEVVKNVQMDAAVSGSVQIEFDHIWVLKKISDVSPLKTLLIKEGELIGYTAAFPEEGAALDFKVKDFKVSNGYGEGVGIEHNVCPLLYFSEELKPVIKEKFSKYYERRKQEKRLPSASSDSCNEFNTRITGTVYGLWFNSNGVKENRWYHYDFGTVHFLSREKYNTEAYNPKEGEVAYYTEMRDKGIIGELDAPARAYRINGDDKAGCFRIEEELSDMDVVYLRFEVKGSTPEDEVLFLSYSKDESVCQEKRGRNYRFNRLPNE